MGFEGDSEFEHSLLGLIILTKDMGTMFHVCRATSNSRLWKKHGFESLRSLKNCFIFILLF